LSLNYIGLGARLLGAQYTISADFPDSGGVFPNAEVTYRGVPVGRVSAMHLLPDGVRVDLRIDPHKPHIPASAKAVVTDRSAVGEALPQTIRLIDDGRTVLDSVNATGTSWRTFAAQLRLLTDRLRTSDPDLRRVLSAGPPAVSELTGLIRDNRTDAGVLLAN